MKLTNRHNLPEAFVNAVKNDGYTRGDADISVTQLLDAPQVVELTRKHAADITEDVEDRIWSLFGQATHSILERANITAIAERRLSVEIEGWKISGGMDLFDIDGVLTDYKTTSAWSLIFDGVKKWERQLNSYAVILRRHGHVVNKLQAVAIIRDWSRAKAKEDPTYPQSMVVNVNIPVWPADVAEKFLTERVILHKTARMSGEHQPCTNDERWVRDEAWAVKKVGGKRAVSGGVYKSEAEAKAHVGFDKGLVIEHRPGSPNRCINYCRVSQWCQQHQDAMAKSEGPTEEASINQQAG